MRSPSVHAVVVNYNTRDLMLDCVASLVRAGGLTITVADSSSSDGSVEALAEQFPEIRGLSVENRGYGAAANAGVEQADSDYVLILNADTVVAPDTVQHLVGQLEARPNTGLAGPRLVYPDGRDQPSRRRFPTLMTPVFESTVLEEWWPSNPWAAQYQMQDALGHQTQEVDWVVGAALMVRSEAYRSVRGFDETFRMYAEETDLCFRLRQHGWGTIFVPDAVVTHVEGASTSQDVPRRQAEFDANRVELQRRMHGPNAARIAAFGIRCGYALTIVREGLKWLVGHRRPLRAERMRFYLRLIGTDFQQHVGKR